LVIVRLLREGQELDYGILDSVSEMVNAGRGRRDEDHRIQDGEPTV
jgi:hypothetical protein